MTKLSLKAIDGIKIATLSAGIYKSGRDDITLFELAEGSTVAAVFTRNIFCAAPVLVAKEHLASASTRYLLINSGNANAGTGKAGLHNAQICCQSVADVSGCSKNQVLPFSTGVIGEPLPADRICSAIPDLVKGLDESNWANAANAIMTTDTVSKGISKTVKLSDGDVSITGIAKGSGMIRPDMATMLAYIATDAVIPKSELDTLLASVVKQSFNKITVDGDTSTNDACVLIASGSSGLSPLVHERDMVHFQTVLSEVFVDLAKQIVRDGEGATKFVTIEVCSGVSEEECNTIAYTIAHSPLVKTALFASDPNWGRILAAIGRSGIHDLNLDKLDIYLGSVRIIHHGEPDPDYREDLGRSELSSDEITLRVDLGRGSANTTIWTCDLSFDYVKINAEYRT